jgi:hypothetical protein
MQQQQKPVKPVWISVLILNMVVLTGRDIYIYIIFFSFFVVANTRVAEREKP